jgi:hypothetical protein
VVGEEVESVGGVRCSNLLLIATSTATSRGGR